MFTYGTLNGVEVRVVVMGVAASGKTSVAGLLAQELDARFVEADNHHSLESTAKMSAGLPLSDEDRWPWLLRLQGELTRDESVVVSCSALRKSYRDLLRRAGNVRFIFLDVSRAEIERRIESRSGHFMGPSMVASQFETLERPDAEPDVIVINGSQPLVDTVRQALDALRRPLPMHPGK